MLDQNGNPIGSRDRSRDRYFLTENGCEREVSMTEYVAAERRNGFKPKDTLPQHLPATASFSRSGPGAPAAASGRIEYGA